MGKPYSTDMRVRMVLGVEDGESRRGVAGRFDVAPSTAVRLFAWYRATGSVAPKKQGRPRGSGKLAAHKDFLIEAVKARPDITMPELAGALASARGVKADPSNISKLLCAAGYSYKKNPSGVGTRAQRREGRAA